ncbi:Crp/Fnr family transcriptional regulator [Paracoccus siganidrum]|uniref:Crp/Fnr family transcriptional regulator n=1 Tax=Paracoccus siganidrum TaxID=1276757 RepID=UPI0014740E76|nr:Crp/Fnr family transcriptional regulator [Paracoccus siganidrum]
MTRRADSTGDSEQTARGRRDGRGAFRAYDQIPQPALLRGMAGDRLRAFLSECSQHSHPASTEILRQGEKAENAFLIARGRVEVSYIDIDGNVIIAHIARPGEVVGEVELFSGRPCAASCRTLPDTVLLSFGADLLFRHVPAAVLLKNLANIMHDRLTRDNRQQSIAQFYPADRRICLHLLNLTTPMDPETRIGQADLASLSGTSRETVNRTLAKLRAMAIIDIGRGRVRILDRARLEAVKLN